MPLKPPQRYVRVAMFSGAIMLTQFGVSGRCLGLVFNASTSSQFGMSESFGHRPYGARQLGWVSRRAIGGGRKPQVALG